MVDDHFKSLDIARYGSIAVARILNEKSVHQLHLS